MDAEFKKLLAGDAWAQDGDRVDPTAVSGVSRASGWGATFSSTDDPPRTLFNQQFRELYGAAKEVGLGVSQYDSDVSYPIGAICQVNGTLYYAVQASDSTNPVNPVTINNSAWSEMGGIGAIPTAPDAIAAGNILIDGSLANRFVVFWIEPDNGGEPITSVDLRYSKSSSFPAASTTIVTSYDAGDPITIADRDSDLYYVSLRFHNTIGTSAWSTGRQVRSSALAPDAVTNLRAIGDTGAGVVDLDWGAPYTRGLSISDYYIEWKSGAQDYDSSRSSTSTTTAKQITGLTDETLYTFRVTARSNRSTNSSPSNEATATPDANPDVPNAPTIAGAASGRGALTAHIAELPNDNNATITQFEWDLKRSGDNWSTPSAVTTKRTQDAIAEFDGLVAGQSYNVRCRAYNGVNDADDDPSTGNDGYGPYSAEIDVNTDSFTSPEQPTLQVRWGYGTSGGFAFYGLDGNINSTGGTEVTSFDVQYKESTADDWTSAVTDASTPTGVIQGLDTEKAYDFQILATNSGSLDSPWSATASLAAFATVPNTPTIASYPGIQYNSGGIGSTQISRHVYCTASSNFDGGKPITRWQFQSSAASTNYRRGSVYTYTQPIGTAGFAQRNRTLKIWARVYNGVGDADNDPTTGDDGWSAWAGPHNVTIT